MSQGSDYKSSKFQGIPFITVFDSYNMVWRSASVYSGLAMRWIREEVDKGISQENIDMIASVINHDYLSPNLLEHCDLIPLLRNMKLISDEEIDQFIEDAEISIATNKPETIHYNSTAGVNGKVQEAPTERRSAGLRTLVGLLRTGTLEDNQVAEIQEKIDTMLDVYRDNIKHEILGL